MALIHELLPKIAAEIGAIEKTSRHSQQNYLFRGIDAALRACAPPLRKHGVTALPRVLSHNLTERVEEPANGKGRATIITRVVLTMEVEFTAPDGSKEKTITMGEALDYNGDRATNKAMASAYKYAMFLGLTLPTDAEHLEDSDCSPIPADLSDEPPPPPAPAKQEKDPVEECKRLIREAKTGERLTELGTRVRTSIRFDAAQRDYLDKLIVDRLEELQAGCA